MKAGEQGAEGAEGAVSAAERIPFGMLRLERLRSNTLRDAALGCASSKAGRKPSSGAGEAGEAEGDIPN